MHRVRAFEILLRNVYAMQPTTPWANKRVEEVRDQLEFFHRAYMVLNGEHLPLAKPGDFPVEQPNSTIEAQMRQMILEGLRAIKWLRLKESAER